MLCYCCSGKPFELCCAPFINNQTTPDNCESLMRSRYTAFCLGKSDYLLATLTPDQRAKESKTELENFIQSVHFFKLEISDVQSETTQGQVSFIASYIDQNKVAFIAETSDFVHLDSWLYHSGRFKTIPASKIKPNTLCPCGSGKKFKHCNSHLLSGQSSLNSQ